VTYTGVLIRRCLEPAISKKPNAQLGPHPFAAVSALARGRPAIGRNCSISERPGLSPTSSRHSDSAPSSVGDVKVSSLSSFRAVCRRLAPTPHRTGLTLSEIAAAFSAVLQRGGGRAEPTRSQSRTVHLEYRFDDYCGQARSGLRAGSRRTGAVIAPSRTRKLPEVVNEQTAALYARGPPIGQKENHTMPAGSGVDAFATDGYLVRPVAVPG